MERLTEFWKEQNMYISGITLSDYADDNGHFSLSEEGVDRVVQKLGKYEDLEDRLNGISVKQVVDGFVKTVENQTCEDYEHGRILTNAEADKWNEYKQLEEQGLLLRLPCKVGDTIYRVNAGAKEPVIKMRVLQVHYKQLHKDRIIIRIDAINDNDMGESCYLLEDFGKTVFFTQEEAEQKLKKCE